MTNMTKISGDKNTAEKLGVQGIDLFTLGLDQVAYIKSGLVDGMPGFTIHAADGTKVAVTTDKELAYAAILQQDMLPVSVH
jgi:hypothetical protein